MKALLKNRARLWMETLEDRTVPTISVVSGALPDSQGNLNITLNTDASNFSVSQTGTAQITLSDTNGGLLTINNVFGNITVNARTTQAAAFAGNLILDGTTSGDITGNVNITLGRLAGATAIDFQLSANSASSILGNFTLTTNAPASSLALLNPASDTTIYGNVTVNLNGGTLLNNKAIILSDGTADMIVRGNFYAPNINQLSAQATAQVLGTATVTTKATTSLANLVDFDAGTYVGHLSLTMGNVSGTGTSTVNFGGTVNGFTTIRLGTNTGANTTNQVNLESGANFFGSQIAITGGNGSKRIQVQGINAGMAKLVVSLGNAAANLVAFTGTNSLLSATLAGGTGVNKVTGTVSFPLYLYRFTF